MPGSNCVNVTEAVVKEMQAKHPGPREGETDRAQRLRIVSAPAAHQTSVEAVERAIRSFPRGSGGGASGLRPQHLKGALAPGVGDEVLRQVAGRRR